MFFLLKKKRNWEQKKKKKKKKKKLGPIYTFSIGFNAGGPIAKKKKD